MKMAFVDPGRPDRVQYFLRNEFDFVMKNSESNKKGIAMETTPVAVAEASPEIQQAEAPPPPRSKREKRRAALKARRKGLKERKSKRKPKSSKKVVIDNSFYKDLCPSNEYDYDSVNEIVVSGVLRGAAEKIHEAIDKNITWWNVDNGYFGRDYRVSLNETSPTKIIPGPPRFDHKIKLQPWRGGTGNHIVILPPSKFYREVFGMENFLQTLIDDLNQLTSRPIMVRPKIVDHSMRQDWEATIRDAYCVITWGSALTIDSMVRGVPTISLGWCPGKPVSFQLEDIETPALENEPNRMEVLNSLTWYTYDRSELPSAYSILRDKLKLLGHYNLDTESSLLPPPTVNL